MRRRTRGVHYITPNHGTSVPRNIVIVETAAARVEMEDGKGEWLERLGLGVAIAFRWEKDRPIRRTELVFSNAMQFWSWFHSRQRQGIAVWMVGHGIARSFTLMCGWDQLDNGMYTLTPRRTDTISRKKDEADDLEHQAGLIVDGDPPTIILLYGASSTLHIVDLENYGRATMGEIAAETLNKIPQRPDEEAPPLAWEKYLRSRAVAVQRYFTGLLTWWHESNLGTWRHTIGGLAMSAYRHRFLMEKIMVHDSKDALEIERASLVGGEYQSYWCGRIMDFWEFHQCHTKRRTKRDKPFRLGPIYHADCNSLYPSVMRDNDYPRQLIAWKIGTAEDYEQWRAQGLCQIAEVRVRTCQRPYQKWIEGERYWCIGEFWTTLCGPELAAAYDAGHVCEFKRLACYLPGKLFTSFVEFFGARKEAMADPREKLRRRFAKLCMNALAGKFGQRAAQWDSIQYHFPLPLPSILADVMDQNGTLVRRRIVDRKYGKWGEMMADGEVRAHRAISGHVQIEGIGGEALDSCPAIEAFVNAYARERMRSVRVMAGDENVIYLANDGLHLTEEGWERIRTERESYPGEIGKFRLVKRVTRGEYRGPHDYTQDGIHTIAGIQSEALENEEGVYTSLQGQTLRSILLQEPGGFLRVKEVRRKIGELHPRGRMRKDGRVFPYRIADGELLMGEEAPALEADDGPYRRR